MATLNSSLNWCDIVGYVGVYEILCTGKSCVIRRIPTMRVMVQTLHKKWGRLFCGLTYPGKEQEVQQVAVWIARTFIPNPHNLPLVDHYPDPDPLNNSINNLRWNTYSGNGANVGIKSTNTSGLKGVCWHTRYKVWQASIRKDGIQHHLGYYTSKEEAGAAYDKAALSIHGASALTNTMIQNASAINTIVPILAAITQPIAKIVVVVTLKS